MATYVHRSVRTYLNVTRAPEQVEVVIKQTLMLPEITVDASIAAFVQVKDALTKTSERWSIVLLIEVILTVVIASEPVLYALAQSDKHTATKSDSAQLAAAEAGVFFAATVPFMVVLVLGLAGIARLNERISEVPESIVAQLSDWSLVQQAEFEEQFVALDIGLRIFGVNVSKMRVYCTVAGLVLAMAINLGLSVSN